MVRPFSIRVCLFAKERATINKGMSCGAFLDFFKRDLAALLMGRRWLGLILDNFIGPRHCAFSRAGSP
jgi:hypothetical protein